MGELSGLHTRSGGFDDGHSGAIPIARRRDDRGRIDDDGQLLHAAIWQHAPQQFITDLYLNLGGASNQAGIQAGVSYWTSLIVADEAAGQTQTQAYANVLGQFVQTFLTYNTTGDVAGTVTSETVAGSSLLQQADVAGGHIKTIAISGAAGFDDIGLNTSATLTSVTTSSSGVVTVVLNAAQTSFVSTGSGQDYVTISQDATKAITGGSATDNEIVLNAAATVFTAADSGVNVTGFQIIGTGANSSGDYILTGAGAILANANVSVNLTGAKSVTGTITLGNGNDSVLDNANTGTVNVTAGNGNDSFQAFAATQSTFNLGSGSDGVAIGLTPSSPGLYTSSVTFAAQAATTSDTVFLGATAKSTTEIATITGLNSVASGSDTFDFAADASATGAVTQVSTATVGAYAQALNLDPTQLNTWVAATLDATHGGAGLALHNVASFQFQGNTYLLEQAQTTGTALRGLDTLVELTGLVTMSPAPPARRRAPCICSADTGAA
jgi:S-layer protein